MSGRAEIGRQARLRGVWVSRESSSLSDRTKNTMKLIKKLGGRNKIMNATIE